MVAGIGELDVLAKGQFLNITRHAILYFYAVSADDTEVGRLKLFEVDILLVEREGYRKRRSEIMASSGQEPNMMGMGDTTGCTHTWPNRTVYIYIWPNIR